jgi:hypothetical protein
MTELAVVISCLHLCLWTKVLLAMIHHIWWQPLLNLHINLLIIFVKYGQHFTVNPNLGKVMGVLDHS